jgi:hypothetical protein
METLTQQSVRSEAVATVNESQELRRMLSHDSTHKKKSRKKKEKEKKLRSEYSHPLLMHFSCQ